MWRRESGAAHEKLTRPHSRAGGIDPSVLGDHDAPMTPGDGAPAVSDDAAPMISEVNQDVDVPVFSISTVNEDGTTDMNIATYASPVGTTPDDDDPTTSGDTSPGYGGQSCFLGESDHRMFL